MDSRALLPRTHRRQYHGPLGAWLCDLVCCGRELSSGFCDDLNPDEPCATQSVALRGGAQNTDRIVPQIDEAMLVNPGAGSHSGAVSRAERTVIRGRGEVLETQHNGPSTVLLDDLHVSQPVRHEAHDASVESPVATAVSSHSTAVSDGFEEDPLLLKWRASALERLAHADKQLLPGTLLRLDSSEGTYRSRSKSRFGKNSHSIDFDTDGVRSVRLAGRKHDGTLAVLRAPAILPDGTVDQSKVATDQWRINNHRDQARSARTLQSFVHLFGKDTSRNDPNTNLEKKVPTWTGVASHEIELYKCQIDNRRCSQLAAMLPLCPTLVKLGLAYNYIGNEGALTLASALPRLTALEDVQLGLNAIEDEGVSGLARALPQCRSLRMVSLRSNGFSATGALALAAALPNCAALRELNVARNNVGSVGREALAAARPTQLSLVVE